jgi:cytochrome c553
VLFQEKGCAGCHGADGLKPSQPIVFANYTQATLTAKIERSMPLNAPGTCSGACAQAVGAYVWALRPAAAACTSVEKPLPRRLRLLTKFEYVNTINDLFARKDASYLVSSLGSDTEVEGFDNNVVANSITLGRMDGFWTAAEHIAKTINPASLLSGCPSTGVAACFVEQFGRKAFRRPLSAEEKADYTALFNLGASAEAGARYVIQTLLASPNFLYRTELGQNGQLTPYEVASLLSYTFWGSMPDEALFTQAANNQLASKEQLKQTVDVMLQNTKARAQFAHFGRQWLRVESITAVARDAGLFPDFNYSIAQNMDTELDMFLQEVLLKSGFSMADVFSTNFTYVNPSLANYYGLPSVSGQQFQRVALNNRPGGILFNGALLTRNAKFFETHPIQRGLLVRTRLLCQKLNPPPPNVGLVEPFNPNAPTRERFAQHTANPACASCHQYIDDIGFAFEQYNAVGQFRTFDVGGNTVDASGRITGLNRLTDPDSHTFTNLEDLSRILATEGFHATSSCAVEQFTRIMSGVNEPDACSLANTVNRWNPAGKSLRDAWIELVAAQSFTQRQ